MKNIENTSPFEFRKPVTGSQFLNHKEAMEDIYSEVGVKTIYFVLGDQGCGNTSVAFKVVEHMKTKYRNRVVVYVSLKGCKTEFQFASVFDGAGTSFQSSVTFNPHYAEY